MALELRDPATGKLKRSVIIGGTLLIAAILFIVSRLGGSNQANGQSSGITDLLGDLSNGINNGGLPPPPGTINPPPVGGIGGGGGGSLPPGVDPFRPPVIDPTVPRVDNPPPPNTSPGGGVLPPNTVGGTPIGPVPGPNGNTGTLPPLIVPTSYVPPSYSYASGFPSPSADKSEGNLYPTSNPYTLSTVESLAPAPTPQRDPTEGNLNRTAPSYLDAQQAYTTYIDTVDANLPLQPAASIYPANWLTGVQSSEPIIPATPIGPAPAPTPSRDVTEPTYKAPVYKPPAPAPSPAQEVTNQTIAEGSATYTPGGLRGF